MRTAIITDSNSGIFEQEGQRMGVFVIPLPVILGGSTYYEGKDITHDRFFRYLSEEKTVSTSQPSITDVLQTWDAVLESGYDEAVYIPMSSGLSGACQTAQALAQDYEGKITVVDNHRISVTLRHAVQDAVFLREQGCSAKEIQETLEKMAYDSIVYVGVGTLEYLKAGGRVTSAGAAIGAVLNIKPLLVIEGERLDAYAKERGTKACQRRLIQAMQDQVQRLSEDGSALQIGVAGSFSDPVKTSEWETMAKEAFPEYKVQYDPLTFSIACHVGPDAFGMGISKKISSPKGESSL